MYGTLTLPSIVRGDTFNGLQITMTTPASPDALPIDLTGYEIRAMFRINTVNPSAITLLMPDPLLTPEEIATEQSQGIFRVISITDAINGIFQIGSFLVNPIGFNIKADFTTYLFDIEFNDGVNIKTLIKGTWKIETDITR